MLKKIFGPMKDEANNLTKKKPSIITIVNSRKVPEDLTCGYAGEYEECPQTFGRKTSYDPDTWTGKGKFFFCISSKQLHM